MKRLRTVLTALGCLALLLELRAIWRYIHPRPRRTNT
jgi:hypothetical protein